VEKLNRKKLTTLLTLVIPLVLSFSSINALTFADEARSAWSFSSDDLVINVEAPSQSYPGEVVPIRVNVTAKTSLRDVYVILWIYGSRYGNGSYWTIEENEQVPSIHVLEDAALVPGADISEEYDLAVPAYVDPGVLYVRVVCKWKTLDLEDYSRHDAFSLTYLKNEQFEELLGQYAELNASYTELQAVHQSEIGGTRNLMYLFVATTIFAAATVFILLFRRPQNLWS
jgi:hypothetical protein